MKERDFLSVDVSQSWQAVRIESPWFYFVTFLLNFISFEEGFL